MLAVGDVQGCFRTLRRLLDRAGFDPAADRLWLAGDLVNRGPRSLAVLRFARELGDRATVVLGNHDIHLLARAAGVTGGKRRDTVADVLAAPDRDELVAWLRAQPLLHVEGRFAMVHAGLLPSWTLAEAMALAREAEAELRGPRWQDLLAATLATPKRWGDPPPGPGRAAATIAVMTRLRICAPEGRLQLGFTGPPDAAPAGFSAWFAQPHQRGDDTLALCGHWAALGFHVGPGVAALDSGCVWGGKLTALRLEDMSVVQEPYAD